MADPKLSAPPPPVESSEETASGTDESEEEEIAQSPPSVTPKYAPPPPQVQQPESSDEEEEEDEEEDGEEEEENTKPNPPAAIQNGHLPPPIGEESDSEEEEEETDDEAPLPVDAAEQDAEENGWVTPPRSEDEKQAEHIQQTLSEDDEVRILEVLAAHRRENGTLPPSGELVAVLAGSLGIGDNGRKELKKKLKTLKSAYTKAARNGVLIKDRDSRFFELCKEVWGGDDTTVNGPAPTPRDFNDMCQMYPFLAEEITKAEKNYPGLYKRQYSNITGEKARALDERIKRQRKSQIKLELRRSDVFSEVMKTLMDLIQ